MREKRNNHKYTYTLAEIYSFIEITAKNWEVEKLRQFIDIVHTNFARKFVSNYSPSPATSVFAKTSWNNLYFVHRTIPAIVSRIKRLNREWSLKERALESLVKDLTDSPSCISVSARRRGPRYLSNDLPTICQRSTGRVAALSNIYRTPLPPCVYRGIGELSRTCACTRPIGSPAAGVPVDRPLLLPMIDSNLRPFLGRARSSHGRLIRIV